jgi:hypothetical protein
MRWPGVTLVVLVATRALAAEPASAEAARGDWTPSVSLFWYLAPGQKNFYVVNAGADHGPLHVELRYHDEAIGTGSALIGWNLEFGETVKFGLTPGVGCLIGDEGGPILALDLALGWGPLSFTSQTEWLWEIQTGKGWFFYTWTELDVRPWPWMRAGAVAQRTRLFQTAHDFIFGPLVGFSVWKVDFSFFWFAPGGTDQTFAVRLELTF